MKTTTLITILTLWLGFGSIVQAQGFDPGVVLYSDRGFHGQEQVLYSDWTQDCSTPFGVESIYIPSGWVVEAYTGGNFTGRSMTLHGDWNGYTHDARDWCNNIRSVRIVERPRICGTPDPDFVPQPPMVTLFEHQDFQGETMQLEGDWTVYQWDEFWNDRISSISIPQGMVVTVYEHSNFSGRSMTLRGDWSVFAWNDAWNDRISSVQIRYDGSLGYR